MTTGVITSEPSPDWRGDTLAADATTGATTLTVDEALDFDDDTTRARWLVVGESDPLEYVDVDYDANTVTLADPTTEDYEAGLPVVLWDPTVPGGGAKVIEYLAPVRLSDGSGTPDAVIPHETVTLNGIDNLVGASVSLVEDRGEWYVDQIYGREPSSAIQTQPTGNRVVVARDSNGGVVHLYGGVDGETPGGLDLDLLSGDRPSVFLRSGTGGGTLQSSLNLIGGTSTGATLEAEDVVLKGNVTIVNGGTAIGGVGTVTQAMRWNRVSTTTDGSGLVTVTHGLGGSPGLVLLTNDTFTARLLSVGTKTSTTFEVRVRDTSGTLLTATSVDFYWLAML